MTNRLANMAAGVLAKLGLASAEPAADIIDATADAQTDASKDGDEDDAKNKDKAKKKPGDYDADADADASAIDEAEVSAALTETATAAAAAATAAANARWAAVIGSEAAAGRTAAAATLLESTGMTADAIIAKLASFPKEGATSFAARMAGVGNPPVSADGAAADTDPRADNHGWDKVIKTVFGSVRA